MQPVYDGGGYSKPICKEGFDDGRSPLQNPVDVLILLELL